jgi:hypothetical protein
MLRPAFLAPCALLAGCFASPYSQAPGQQVPSFYRPGVHAPAEPEVYGQPVAGDPGVAGPAYPRTPSSAPLLPEEKQRQEPETWLENVPVAGPAPRNVEGGGQLGPGMVASGPEGTAVVGAATHGVEPAESGRLYILELYQQVLDQRDALQQEVAALHADLELAQKEIEGLGGRATDGESRVGALEQEVASLRAENQDLAGRLTTAQVRRLEAEKLLLQAKIEIQRARSEADAEGVARKDEGK